MPDTANPASGEPMTPAPIVICADDYGHDAGTSAVIRGLAEAGRISATSCLVESEGWVAEAGALRALTDSRPGLAIGLHLNLTERLANTTEPRLVAPIGAHIARAFLPVAAGYEDAVLAAFRAQWAAFVAGVGRAPDFIDGHEHVHLFPSPRRALLRLASEVEFGGWVRQCRTSSPRTSLKRLILDPFSRSFAAAARSAGLAANPGFGGLRRFDPAEDMTRLWRTDLAAMTGGGVLMAHPGTGAADRAGRCRDQEAGLMATGALAAILSDLGLDLARDAKAPWGERGSS